MDRLHRRNSTPAKTCCSRKNDAERSRVAVTQPSLPAGQHRAEGHDEQTTVPATTQFVYQAHDLDKPEIVSRVLQADHAGKVMIFTRTKRAASGWR